MTYHPPTPEPCRPDQPYPPDDGLGTVPEWLRQPVVAAEPARADRLRIWLGGHLGKVLAGAAALLLLTFFGLVGTAGYRAFQRWGELPAAYPTISPPAGEQASLLDLGTPSYGGPEDPDPDAVFDPERSLDIPDTC